MTGYIGIGGTAKKIKKIYIGVGGVAKQVKKGYIGVGGVAKLWYSAASGYVWERYNVNSYYVEIDGTAGPVTQSSAGYVGSSYTFDSTTGSFSVTQTTNIALSSTGASNAVGKYYITWATSFSYTPITGNTVYKIIAASYNSSWRVLNLTVQPITAQLIVEKGTYIEDVTSEDLSDYPVNGAKGDGYWYVWKPVYDYALNYTGNYIDSVIEENGTPYRLIELTSSGSLSLGEAKTGDIWICGGGGSGAQWAGNGGGGSYAVTANNRTFQNLTVVIGAGGTCGNSTTQDLSSDGGQTSVSGGVSLSANGGDGGGYDHGAGSGGTGGGAGGNNNTAAGTGDGIAKTPFASNYFIYPYCDGGGGGGRYSSRSSSNRRSGGAGGTNGGNGGANVSGSYTGGTGGGHYGGAGGGSNNSYSARPATGYGSGGGGAGNNDGSGGVGGSGYQGVCFIRIPIDA